ncbi:hypothetical protein TanjilG_26644 [Lupinus angustifolius]|uniref:Annexin n=1 Tax=Lupinus angustifolius TaxID=3871 RepID=A0A1J7GNK4_LUPAN|nr:PREDICTED: annexin D2-like [Lupinus angustifolius]OIW02104.1 hypothetical protein TanjilG_26644 [Lupinus angustifolius]
MASLNVPSQVPPVAEDCEKLRKAFVGWGTDEACVISILAHRNAMQRSLIRQTYAETFGEDLLKSLADELSGDFERAVLLWILNPAERDALLANEAIKKGSAGHCILMEIACTRSSHHLFLVREDYHIRFKRSLVEDVAHHTSGEFRKILVPFLMAHRYEGPEVNMELATSEAKIIHEKITENAYSHEELIRILTTRSKAQLSATFNSYNDLYGSTINKNLKADPKDKYLAFLRGAIKCLSYPEKYFEKVLRLSMKGFGTDEESLTRVVVTRAEVDMENIKEEYHRRNNVSLENDIKGDTSGDYQRMLLALIGNKSV